MNPHAYKSQRNQEDDDLILQCAIVAVLVALAMIAAVVFSGCGAEVLRKDPNAELVAAGEVFAATVNVLTELKKQGQLGDDEIEDIGAMIHLGEKYLIQWRAAIAAGERDADAVTAFRMILAELQKVKGQS